MRTQQRARGRVAVRLQIGGRCAGNPLELTRIPFDVVPVLLNGRTTSALGFGGSLLGSTPPAQSRRLLAAAYDAGIRHFDVAPMYSHGAAERLLREALGARLQNVTITSKYGLEPPHESPVRRLARAMLQPFPALKLRFQQPAAMHANEPLEDPSLPPLTAVEAQRSLDQSLANLGVDTLDLLLLHEATPGRLNDPGLLEMLERNRLAGKIGQFGVGSRSARVEACLEERPDFCQFLQYEWSVFARPNPALEQHPRTLHGSLGNGYVATQQEMDLWSAAANLDLRTPGLLPSLLLKASLLHNAGRVVLFSTRSVANILANVATAESSSLDVAARALASVVRAKNL